jgi:hypothetical protein
MMLKACFVLATCLAAGLVTAGVVSGAGPLAVLSTDSTTETTDTTTTTETTTTESEPAPTESTETEPPPPSGPPTISSDKPDYAPGELVTLTGSNWQPGEAVTLDVNDDQGQTWRRTALVTADAGGAVVDQFNLPDWFVATYAVAATGTVSGTATTSFTDGNVRFLTSGPTLSGIAWQRHNDSTCTSPLSGTANSGTGTLTSSTATTLQLGNNNNQSLGLTAPASAGSETFVNWTGDGSAVFTTSGSGGRTICVQGFGGSGIRAVTANYATPTFSITFSASGIPIGGSSDSSGTVVTVGATAYTASQLPISLSFASGSSVTYTFSTPVSATVGKRYLHASTTGPSSPFTVSASTTVTGNYGTQFQLSLATSPAAVGAGNISGASNGDWFDSGATVNLTAATPVLSLSGDSRYVFSDWSGDATGTANPAMVTMSAPRSVTANYDTEHKLTLATAPAAVALTNISGGSDDTFYPQGTVLTLTAGSPVLFNSGDSRYVFASWSGDATGTGNPVSVTMSAPRSVTADYGTEHKLSLATDPAAVGLPNISGGSDGSFYAEGTVLNLTAATPVLFPSGDSRYVFSDWSGDAPGAANPAMVTMSAPRSVTANYDTEHKVTFAESGIAGDGTGTVVTVGGTPFTEADLPDTTFWAPGTTWTFSSPVGTASAEKRYRLTSTASGTIGSADAGTTITGTYLAQFKLTLATSPPGIGGAGNPSASPSSGDGFYDESTDVQVTADDPVAIDAGSRWRFDEWSGDASGSTNPVSVTMNGVRSVTAEYVKQFDVTFTQSGIGGDTGANTVGTIGGSAQSAGDLPLTDWFDTGTTWSFEALVQTDPSSGTRYSRTSAASGTVTAAGTITGVYVTQYRLDLATDPVAVGISSISGAADGSWHNAGTVVALTAATPVSIDATSRYRLDHWSGGASGSTNPVSVTMNAPKLMTANYVIQYLVTFGQTGITLPTGPNTIVTVDGSAKAASVLPVAKWYDTGVTAMYAYSSPVFTFPVSATQFALASVTGPTSPLTVSGPATVTGNYVPNLFSIRYLKPLDQTTDGSVVNTGKNGRVIPVKIELFKDGVQLDSSTVPGDVTIRVIGASCSPSTASDPVEEYADAGNSNGNTNLFRWTSEGWIYNLDTKALGLTVNKCYRLDVYIGGTSAIYASASTYALFKPVK